MPVTRIPVCLSPPQVPTYLTYIQCLRRRLTERQPASPQRYLSYVQKPVLDDETDPVQLYFGHTSIHVYMYEQKYTQHMIIMIIRSSSSSI